MCRAISLRRLLLLLLQLSQLLAVTQGKTLVLGKEGESAELPCESSQKKITVFTWKFSDQRKILGQHGKGVLIRGFQSTAITAYKSEGESAEFSFPLNFAEENGWGELMWKAEKDSFFQPWISFSIKNKEVSVQKSTKDLKLQLKETLPLTLKIPQVSLQFAVSGNLTLTLDKGTLHQEVNLVVMKVAQLNNTLTCEVMGPTSPKMRLTLKQENQEARVSEEQKVVQVVAPETGLWQCLLSEGDKVKMDSRIQAPGSTNVSDQEAPQ